MTSSDAGDGASDAALEVRGRAGFWVAAAFTVVIALGAAFPSVRTWLLAILTAPVRLVGWALPGDGRYGDAVRAAEILSWAGRLLLAFVWLPLLIIVWEPLRRAWPALGRFGDAWARLLRGAKGFTYRIVAASAGLPPLIVVIVLSALGAPTFWLFGPALLVFLVVGCPLLVRVEERPLFAFTRGVLGGVEGIVRFTGDCARWAGLALVVVVAIAVTQRYVFGITFTKLDELVVYLHAAMFMLVAAATLKVDGHVRVDVLYGARSPRGKALINFVGFYALLAPLCFVILATSPRYIDLAWRVGEGSTETDGLPLVYLLKTVIPAFAVLLLAQGAALTARAALLIVGADSGEEDVPPEHHEVI